MKESIIKSIHRSYILAKEALSEGNYPIGWVLLVNNDICIEWKNRVISDLSPQLHAEIDIIQKAEKYEGNDYHKILFISMEPCNMCANALIQFWIDEVYYIMEDSIWWGSEILRVNGIQVFQTQECYEEYKNFFKDFLLKTGKYPELLAQYDTEYKSPADIVIAHDIKKSESENFICQIPQCIDTSLTIKPGMYSEQQLKQSLYSLIESRMFRYAVRIRDEYGLKTEDEIKARFYEIVRDIFSTASDIALNKKSISMDDMHALHRKLFPKGLWWQVKWANGVVMKALLPAGEFRTTREFRMYDGVEYDYMSHAEIEENLQSAERFLGEESSVHFLVRLAVYLHRVWFIHPYYNGNGTLFMIIVGIRLVQNGYIVPQNLDGKIQKMIDEKVFLEADSGNIEPLVRRFLDIFKSV